MFLLFKNMNKSGGFNGHYSAVYTFQGARKWFDTPQNQIIQQNVSITLQTLLSHASHQLSQYMTATSRFYSFRFMGIGNIFY